MMIHQLFLFCQASGRTAVRPKPAAERRLALLADSGVVLARSLDFETTLAEIAQLVVPDLAD